VIPDGPVYAAGDLLFLDADSRPVGREVRAALCRCGASANKPFCDGRHADVGFHDSAALADARLRSPNDETDTRLAIRLRPDGPLVLEGRFTVSGTGGQAVEAASGALCRCGASRTKPFCDGTHREIGFEAEDRLAASGESGEAGA
jgi:CDGSH-type Zn-finger protein